jgi:hypothetical protein
MLPIMLLLADKTVSFPVSFMRQDGQVCQRGHFDTKQLCPELFQ